MLVDKRTFSSECVITEAPLFGMLAKRIPNPGLKGFSIRKNKCIIIHLLPAWMVWDFYDCVSSDDAVSVPLSEVSDDAAAIDSLP